MMVVVIISSDFSFSKWAWKFWPYFTLDSQNIRHPNTEMFCFCLNCKVEFYCPLRAIIWGQNPSSLYVTKIPNLFWVCWLSIRPVGLLVHAYNSLCDCAFYTLKWNHHGFLMKLIWMQSFGHWPRIHDIVVKFLNIKILFFCIVLHFLKESITKNSAYSVPYLEF